MKLANIVFKLRLSDTHFGNYIFGTAEFVAAQNYQMQQDTAFVIPLSESAAKNEYDSGLSQRVTETFGVIVALKNDLAQSDKFGVQAYNKLFDIREELFRALLGWNQKDAESLISYRGARLVDMTPAWLWWQYEFSFEYRIFEQNAAPDNKYCLYGIKESDVGLFEDMETLIEEIEERIGNLCTTTLTEEQRDNIQKEVYNQSLITGGWVDFKTIYANFILAPSADLPHTGDLPLDDNFPNVVIPNQAQWIDMTKHPDDGAFGDGFGLGLDIKDRSER